MGISLRLQEERKRLGLTQEAIAARIDATKRSVINWEGGAALPGAEVLARYTELGADILYILTGQRDSAQPRIASEQVLMDNYRLCSAKAQQNLVQTAALLATGAGAGVDAEGLRNSHPATAYANRNLPSPGADSLATVVPKPGRKRATKTDK